jgi:hypothetical protein
MVRSGHPQEQAVAAALKKARGDDGMTISAAPPTEAKGDNGPDHAARHPGKDALYHMADSTPLAKLEREIEDNAMCDKVMAHCDEIEKRLDDCETGMRKRDEDAAISNKTHMAR